MPDAALAPATTPAAAPAPVPTSDLHHAVILRAQKEQRAATAREAYWSAFTRKAGLEEVARLFDAMRFADQELRRARAHLEDLLHDAAKGGVAA